MMLPMSDELWTTVMNALSLVIRVEERPYLWGPRAEARDLSHELSEAMGSGPGTEVDPDRLDHALSNARTVIHDVAVVERGCHVVSISPRPGREIEWRAHEACDAAALKVRVEVEAFVTNQGAQAARKGVPLEDNPYPDKHPNIKRHRDWDRGWSRGVL